MIQLKAGLQQNILFYRLQLLQDVKEKELKFQEELKKFKDLSEEV